MDIIRLPKGKPVAYLKLSKGWNGQVQSGFMLQGAMSGFSENGEYATVELAEAALLMIPNLVSIFSECRSGNRADWLRPEFPHNRSARVRASPDLLQERCAI